MGRPLIVSKSRPIALGIIDLGAVTIEDLHACDPLGTGPRTDAAAAVKRNLEKLNLTHVRALFATKKLAFSTSMIMAVWGLIGKKTSKLFRPRPLLTTHRSRLPTLQRLPSIHPSNAWRQIWRRQHLSHVPQFTHHCLPRCPRSASRRFTRRNTSLWSQRGTCSFHDPNRCVLVRLNDSDNEQRAVGLELRVQFLLQYHVRSSLRIHTRDLSYKGSRDWECPNSEHEPDIWNHGCGSSFLSLESDY